MEAHKQAIAEYTSQFTKYQAMQEELLKLQELQQKTKQRLVEIDVKQRRLYPQVNVVEWASLPSKPVRPDYLTESAVAFAACLSLGLLAVWMADYLSRESSEPSPVTLSGIHLYPQRTGFPGLEMPQSTATLAYDSIRLLPQEHPRELSSQEISALFHAADQQALQVISLLLNGLTAEEIVSLTADAVDLVGQRIHIHSRGRAIAMGKLAASVFTSDFLRESPKPAFNLLEIDALLTCAAIDGGLTHPEQINAEIIRFTYMLFLVRQGLRLAELAKVVGSITPSRLVELGRYSPEQVGVSLENINLDYPVIG
jgi:hypothetical protein